MARPNKNNAEYFSHDNSMRNHRKIKALRQKYEMDGYGVYVMLLETLTGSDSFEIRLKKDLDWITLAGDFGLEVKHLKEIISFMAELELIQNNENIIVCDSLNKRMVPLLEKRIKSKEIAQKLPRDYIGRFVSDGTYGVSVAETPQSKVKESKGKENNYILANANNNPIKTESSLFLKGTEMDTLYKKFTAPAANIPVNNQWQDEATNACAYLEADDEQKSSIFKFYKNNQFVARNALNDCKELGHKSANYFFKVCNDMIKKQELQKNQS